MDLPFVAAKLAPYYTSKETGATRINKAIDQLPVRLSNVAVVSTEELLSKDDGVHLDTPSSRILGQRYATAMLRLHTESPPK